MKKTTVSPIIWLALTWLLRQATSAYVSHACTNSSTLLSPNTTYYSNLKVLLSYLASNATNPGGFYKTTVASETSDPAIGLIVCRGDIFPGACGRCATNATSEALRRCPLEKAGVVWYDECWLRYQDRPSFFTTPGVVPAVSFPRSGSIAGNDSGQFSDVLARTMGTVVSEAVNSGKRFATEEAAATGSRKLYSLAQCTPDLSARECDTCLRSAVASYPSCCGGKEGGTALLPSCVARYELYPFYNVTKKEAIIPPPPPRKKDNGKNRGIIFAVLVPIGVVFVAFIIIFLVIRRKILKKRYLSIRRNSMRDDISMGGYLQLSMDEIEIATDNFSEANKIGKGGFGEVFLGTLPDGQKIAVKKLLRASGQGEEQFKNEAVLVAKLQHRNLVRLLGFCLDRQKKILVYEFVPNKSLDYFIFDEEKKSLLDWTRRYKIIGGIARGILYLHEDSRLKIIHRDLKASNILLDDEMNPKISDFGMAKVFISDQTHGTTGRIAGTYGYMSPEYAMHGQFSVKSDVFSFGVLVLEILSGKKNNSYYQSNFDGDLLGAAWEQWKNGTPLEFLDPNIRHSVSRNEAIRCIHMGLLCVQENPSVRPTMPTIVLMLDSYSVTLALPQEPAVLHRNRIPSSTPRRVNEPTTQSTKSSNVLMSVNDESMITEVYPR